MKRIFFIIQALFITALYGSAAYGQGNDASKSIISKLETFSARYITEKAYLQFDKPCYAAGDTIYFKAYITQGPRHEPSGLSGVLHVDLINTGDKISQSIRLLIDSGVTWGDFALPDSLPPGNYRVRAYTQWMRNEGEKDFFDKVILIGSLAGKSVAENNVKQPLPANAKPDIQFLPEGGSLVNGIRSKVAFKAIGSNGLGIGVKGTVKDNEGKEIVSFASAHLGMGYFYLAPRAGKTYKAELTYSNGTLDAVDLPKAEPSGITLSVNNDSLPKAIVTLMASNEYYQQNRNKAYTLLIYSGGIATTVSCPLDSPLIRLAITKRKLRTGVATVTLFSPDNEPLCERLLFIQNYDQLRLKVNGGKTGYSTREKVNIKLNAINHAGDAAEGHFSVSVTDENKVPQDGNDGGNIMSYLLLTSDLKGYVEQPGYYFADTSKIAVKNLDILMLTQGYRRFEWKQVLDSSSNPLAYQAEKGIEISGQIKSPFNKAIDKGTVTLIPSQGGPILSSTSDDKGMFRFSNLIFIDTVHFVLSAVNAKGKNTTTITYYNYKNDEPAVAPDLQPAGHVLDGAMPAFVENDKLQQQQLLNDGIVRGKMLQEVTIKDKKPDNQYHTLSLAGAGFADQVMHADEIEKVQGPLSTSLNGRLRGVMFIGQLGQVEPYLNLDMRMGILSSSPQKMLVVIDGVEGADMNGLTANDVETVEVLKTSDTKIYGLSGESGVLVITTKQGGGLHTKDVGSEGVLPVSVMGFYKAREFYSPKYDHANTTAAMQHDLRSTIYWQPEIKTGKDGNASFNYYNADGTGTYKVVIEGMDGDGNIGRQVYRYEVK